MSVPMNFKNAYDFISEKLATTLEDVSDFDTVIQELQVLSAKHLWLKDVVEELKKADEHTKTLFIVNANKIRVNAKLVYVSSNRDHEGYYDTKVLESNSNQGSVKLFIGWQDNFYTSALNNNGVINKKVLQKAHAILKRWENNGGLKKQSNQEYIKFLSIFGVELTEPTLDAIRNDEFIYYSASGRGINTFGSMFDIRHRNDVLSRFIGFTMDYAYSYKELNFIKNKNYNPYNGISTMLNLLAEFEHKNNMDLSSATRYVNKKLLFEFENPSYFTQQTKRYKGELKKGNFKDVIKISKQLFLEVLFI